MTLPVSPTLVRRRPGKEQRQISTLEVYAYRIVQALDDAGSRGFFVHHKQERHLSPSTVTGLSMCYSMMLNQQACFFQPSSILATSSQARDTQRRVSEPGPPASRLRAGLHQQPCAAKIRCHGLHRVPDSCLRRMSCVRLETSALIRLGLWSEDGMGQLCVAKASTSAKNTMHMSVAHGPQTRRTHPSLRGAPAHVLLCREDPSTKPPKRAAGDCTLTAATSETGPA